MKLAGVDNFVDSANVYPLLYRGVDFVLARRPDLLKGCTFLLPDTDHGDHDHGLLE
jgi:hypothetical protein